MTEPKLTPTGLPIDSRETISALQHDIMIKSTGEQLQDLLKTNPVVGEAVAPLAGQFANEKDNGPSVQIITPRRHLLFSHDDQ